MAAWFDRLVTGLKARKRPAKVWAAGDGQLLVSPAGARLLACEMPGVDGNLFWHDPAMEDEAGSDAIAGGDRVWIAPEVGFIFNPLDAARVDPIANSHTPKAMDPGQWHVLTDERGRTALQADMLLTDHRLDARIGLRVTREFFAIDRPAGVPAALRCSSFGIRNTLQRRDADRGTVAGAWDLLQLPPTGTLICPTTVDVGEPTSYYEPFGDHHVHVADDCVRFLIDGKHRIKMGLLAEHTTGRMGYYRRVGDVSTLIFRVFAPQPGRAYVDVPRDRDATFGGDALQAYNDDGTFGGFGEMEYHDPALVTASSTASMSGACVTHVLVGDDDTVRAAGAALLGVAVEPLD